MISIKDISILAIYGYILFYVLKSSQKMEIILLTIVAFYLLTTNDRYEGLENSSPVSDTEDKKSETETETKTETVGSKLNMGPYDGLCLKTGNEEYWMKSPDNSELVSNEQLFTYLGSQGPLKMALSDQAALTGPSITGKEGSPTKMSIFANNQASLSCCPSTYSTSTGCICTTEDQRRFINSRGVPGSDSKTNEF